jgi:hypothetical protein
MDMTDRATTDTRRHVGRVGLFRIGDVVRNGAHVATVTDVGTVLIAVRTTAGAARMVCPWELVRLHAGQCELGVSAPR